MGFFKGEFRRQGQALQEKYRVGLCVESEQDETPQNNPPDFWSSIDENFTPLESQSCQESVGGAANGILPLHVQRHARCLRLVGCDEIQILPTVPPI